MKYLKQVTFLPFFAICLIYFSSAKANTNNFLTKKINVCDEAAKFASAQTQIPLDVLKAIARVESGQTRNGVFEPWPWTINMEGKGMWLDTQSEIIALAHRQIATKANSFDIGCFQINYRWHGHHFASIQEMSDPKKNALYAAKFLKKLHMEFGNWTEAAGAYHSRSKRFADLYKTKFSSVLSSLRNTKPTQPPTNAIITRVNNYPLLRGTGSHSSPGSLFPKSKHSLGSLFASPDYRG
ncbi:MAG: transglycosylase SLT domain-containing protein [Roseobacter sp.]